MHVVSFFFKKSNPDKKDFHFAGRVLSLTSVKFHIAILVVETPELTHRNSKLPSVDKSVLRHILTESRNLGI